MADSLEIFDGATNVEFKDLTYLQELGAELPVFKIKEPSIEEWNKKARIQNTKMFVEILNRQPKDYQEVLTWVYGFIPGNENSHSARNTTAIA